MRHGIDFDHIHPTCTAEQIAEINAGGTPVCIPTGPIVYDANGDTYNNIPDGNLLQIMPWPTFSNMSDHDIEAIYVLPERHSLHRQQLQHAPGWRSQRTAQ